MLCEKELDNDSDYYNHCFIRLKEEEKSIDNLKIYVNKRYEEQQKKETN